MEFVFFNWNWYILGGIGMLVCNWNQYTCMGNVIDTKSSGECLAHQ